MAAAYDNYVYKITIKYLNVIKYLAKQSTIFYSKIHSNGQKVNIYEINITKHHLRERNTYGLRENAQQTANRSKTINQPLVLHIFNMCRKARPRSMKEALISLLHWNV